ncbi:HopJ type III effector protein [Marinobacterium stanieri]|uniref:HopJ type III effector protein n=1 Tax=Marinobacterium stanieri TaxID=49186 RepID=A0A1N6UU15_9GAMM|nr:HopJ type III effector protein [Marinobacterium stanieri]SIQ68716.1 HopJ type III effector protein [Marinobacterium stanieri]
MTPEEFASRIGQDDSLDFEDTQAVISEYFDYTPCAFSNGEVANDAGQNEGSCKIFALGQLLQLDQAQTLACFGRFYRDVLNTPDGSDHGNIRNFMVTGWDGIKFEGQPLQRKA